MARNKRNSPIEYMPHLQMELNPARCKLLGIWFTNSLKHCKEINLREKFAEIKALSKVWMKRQIISLGRDAILRSLILSKIVYL